MRQQSKPFIVERKPTRKPKPDLQKPSIWGSLDTDIAIGLRVLQETDQQNACQEAANGDDDNV